MNAILINSDEQTIEYIELDKKAPLNTICDLIRGNKFGEGTEITEWQNNGFDLLYINEKAIDTETKGFMYEGVIFPFMGNGIITRLNKKGDFINVQTTIHDIINKIKFFQLVPLRTYIPI